MTRDNIIDIAKKSIFSLVEVLTILCLLDLCQVCIQESRVPGPRLS